MQLINSTIRAQELHMQALYSGINLNYKNKSTMHMIP